MITTDRLAQAFAIGSAPATDEYRFGTVSTVNDDGSVYVQLAQGSLTRCACLYEAKAGDRVQVCIKANGQAVVLGSIGKEETKEYPSYYIALDEPQGFYELYNNASGNKGTIALNDALANYKMIDIYHTKPEDGYSFGCTRVYEPDGKYANLVSLRLGHSAQIMSKSVAMSGTSIRPSSTYCGYFNPPSSTAYENSIAIYQVIGYK